MFSIWTIDKLAALKNEEVLIVRDSLRLLVMADGALHRFAADNGFTVIAASTNLVFRELYEKAVISQDTKKILVIDRAPVRRRTRASMMKAPPPFYPDLLSRTGHAARIDLNLRHFLTEKTGDPGWPHETNDPQFARLISDNIKDVLKAHSRLRTVDPARFTDRDFRTIIAFSALGVPEAAFKKPEAKDYWRIGLFGYPALEELDALIPEVAQSVRNELSKASSPFKWFADSPPELVIKAFYLAAILSQHFEHWKLLIPTIDPALKRFCDMDDNLIDSAACELASIDHSRAEHDIKEVEESLTKEDIKFILLEQLNIFDKGGFAEIIENERYSILLRSLALSAALESVLSRARLHDFHERVANKLFSEPSENLSCFVEQRSSQVWENLKTAYNLAISIIEYLKYLDKAVTEIKVKKRTDLTLDWFREIWNDRRVNRLEYYLSALDRLVFNADVLPRSKKNLPKEFSAAWVRIRNHVGRIGDDVNKTLTFLNERYQEMIREKYKRWVEQDTSEVWLTSRFLSRCLKPHWDIKKEKAVVFVFDGMRYDIWDELVRPIFEDRMELIAEYPAVSLLPSETLISRKSIFAGTFPDEFNTREGEDSLLAEAMKREFGYNGKVDTTYPESMGTGETVRYSAGNIEFFIFDLCDKELHKIPMKKKKDGRYVPGRPLAFIYQQHIKDIIDNEVMGIIRDLTPDTKVFITADHGFGLIGRESIRINLSWLNEPGDCHYLNAWLRNSLRDAGAPGKLRDRVLEFPVGDLRLPDSGEGFDRSLRRNWKKKFATVVFPKPGYALARPKARFKPDAYSHGGISIQEMIVPMLAMRVKAPEESYLILGHIQGPEELIEGEAAEFKMSVRRSKSLKKKEIRIEAQAAYRNREEIPSLNTQIQYISVAGGNVVFRFIPDAGDATEEERKKGIMARTLRISILYHEEKRMIRKTQSFRFSVLLNSEKIVRRVPAHLGKILGLTPKSMR